MGTLVLHDRTASAIDDFVARPSHSLLLHGPPGSGKQATAQLIAARLLNININKFVGHPYVHVIDAPAISSESIEAVRKLEHFLSLRVPEPGIINRIVIIADGHSLSTEAQNALLKTVEEPPESTLIIITANKPSDLLATIQSRLQTIAVQKPLPAATYKHFEGLDYPVTDVQQAYMITGGLPGLMAAILSDKFHPLKPATDLARRILQSSFYDRLLLTEELTKERQQFKDVLYILSQMAQARLQATTGEQFDRWNQIMTLAYAATEQLNNNAQPKLVLDSLLLKLK